MARRRRRCGWGGLCLALLLAAPATAVAAVTGHLHALALFARFQGEGAETALPAFAGRLFAADQPGSLSHYFGEMSRGQYRLSGECAPTWLTADQGAEAYVPPLGSYTTFTRQILAQADAQVDFARFDNDGPDGVPDSGDDDGYVDFLFVVTRSAPPGFIYEQATGIAALGLSETYITSDRTRSGTRVCIRADQSPDGAGGVLQQATAFEPAVGSMAHEFGHFLGLADLYDRAYGVSPVPGADDGAGVGWWDLMGHGARGWSDRGGPNSLSAFSLKQLGWLGRDNAQLEVLTHDQPGAELADLAKGGRVYQLPTRTPGIYYLLECRRRDSSYYDRNAPGDGLLIWRINESVAGNSDESAKRVDLVCADGLYADAGAPLGALADPVNGADNLDFWAHDDLYRQAHAGNLGDAGDLFDGVRYTAFNLLTNPAAEPGIAVENLHPRGTALVADLMVRDRRRAGPLAADETWSDTVDVVGDVVVPAGVALRLAPGCVVRFHHDGLRSGLDPARAELIVEGSLSTDPNPQRRCLLTSATAVPAPGDWYGVVLRPLAEVTLHQVAMDFAVHGLATAGEGLRQPLVLDRVVVRRPLGDGMLLEGVENTVELSEVQVHDAGGFGLSISGAGLVRVLLPHLSGNRFGGLQRRGGYLQCRYGQFSANAVDPQSGAAEGADVVVGDRVFGEIADNTLAGGVGISCLGSLSLAIEGNRFSANGVGLFCRSSAPIVTGNQFDAVRQVVRCTGFSVPARFDLNAVQGAERLVDNQASVPVTATNNWWGRDDETWIAARMDGAVVWRPWLAFDPRQTIGFSLAPARPNPFDAATTIDYSIGVNEIIVRGGAWARLEVRNAVGGLVRRLADGSAAPGFYTATWDGRDQLGEPAASGVYYVCLQVGPLAASRRLVLLR